MYNQIFAKNQDRIKEELDASFVRKYESSLQNIEFAICSMYRKHVDVIDHEVLQSLDVLIREYSNEQQGIASRALGMGESSLLIYKAVKEICEWRLGRAAKPFETGDNEFILQVDGITLSFQELIMCLKKIRSSVVYWNKQNGRQGYLEFIHDYV